MTVVSRSDMYAPDEKGADWFNEFMLKMSGHQSQSIQDIMNIITDKRGDTVDSVVQSYRDQVGLDIIADGSQVKEASFRPLSVRHARMGTMESSLPKLKEDPDFVQDVDSFCEHTGGTKNTMSIIHYLRDKFGDELISFSDGDLKEYIESRKDKFHTDDKKDTYDVGRIGQDEQDEYSDDMADYQAHDAKS